MTRSVLMLSGPNLDLLGRREIDIYGSETLADHLDAARRRAADHELDLVDLQSNHEGELVEAVHAARDRHDAIIVNPGALTHFSWSLHDALAAFDGPVIELHLSNPSVRESWRRTSVVTPVATGSIVGFGGHGYVLAVDAVARLLR